MTNDSSCHSVGFDAYVEDYDAALAQGLSISGEDKNYFAQGGSGRPAGLWAQGLCGPIDHCSYPARLHGRDVAQLERVSDDYLKRYGLIPRHPFHEAWLWVDADVTPMPIGAKAEGELSLGAGSSSKDNRPATVSWFLCRWVKKLEQ